MDIEFLDEAPLPILLTNQRGLILFANIAAMLMLQRTKENLVQHDMRSLIKVADQSTFDSMLDDPELHPNSTCTFCNAKRELITTHLTVSKVPAGYVWYLENREEYNSLQKELKLLKNLPKEYGHDINNLLTVILSAAEMIELEVDKDNIIIEDLSDIGEAAQRAASQTRLFMNLGRQASIRKEYFDINVLLDEQRTSFESILQTPLQYDLTPQNCFIYTTKSDILIALTLLMLHMREKSKAESFVLETRICHISPPFSSHVAGLLSSSYVICTLRDTDFPMMEEYLNSDHFHAPDESPLLSITWEALIRARGSIVQRYSPHKQRCISLYIPEIQPPKESS
ncbi:MAG: hypothetical protein VX278_22925 [Myxococcota bacterium]|nr:hypothetical protein [Myxococcota bacterium]